MLRFNQSPRRSRAYSGTPTPVIAPFAASRVAASRDPKTRASLKLSRRTRNWRVVIFLITVAISALADAECLQYSGGDPIGADSQTTNETGGFTALFDDGVNRGQPAIEVSLDGDQRMHELRVIVFGAPNIDGDLRFDQFDYRLDIWRTADYLAGAAPQYELNLDNPLDVELITTGPNQVTPAEAFGSAGAGGNNALTYDFRFDLLAAESINGPPEPLSQPLPAGGWILGFQSYHDDDESGLLRVSGAVADSGPLPYFSRDDSTPRGILGGQDPSNALLYWGMSLAVESTQQISLPGDFNGDGIVDAADYTVWRDTNASTGSGCYETWRSHFGQTLMGAVVNSGALDDSSQSDAANGIVPEPPASAMMTIVVAAFHLLRRRRQGQANGVRTAISNRPAGDESQPSCDCAVMFPHVGVATD